jgi:uncharacterized CHY-type Zn-finger protein
MNTPRRSAALSSSTVKAPECSECHAELEKIDYTTWGAKIFDPSSGSYLEDESLGGSDIEFSCPNCAAKLNPEGLIF